jgi:hypothetical protein
MGLLGGDEDGMYVSTSRLTIIGSIRHAILRPEDIGSAKGRLMLDWRQDKRQLVASEDGRG